MLKIESLDKELQREIMVTHEITYRFCHSSQRVLPKDVTKRKKTKRVFETVRCKISPSGMKIVTLLNAFVWTTASVRDARGDKKVEGEQNMSAASSFPENLPGKM